MLCGGQSIGPQIGSLEHGAHIVVGTPGRIKDHLRKKTLSLSRLGILVLDEADRMLDMGFYSDIETIIHEMPDDRQTLLFSATYPDKIKTLSSSFQRNPVEISVESVRGNEKIHQQLFICDKRERLAGLQRLLMNYPIESAVIFCNTIKLVKEVCDYLVDIGISAKAIHGDLEQRDRDQVLIQFANHSCSLLVATDVAARGLDIEDLPAVINFELPREPDVYIHRIGRTGRAGKEGLAFSLFTDSEKYRFDAISTLQENKLNFESIGVLKDIDRQLAAPPMVTLCISGGRKDKFRPGDIVGALTGEAGMDGSVIGKISVLDFVSYVAIERHAANDALRGLEQGKIKGRKVKIRKLR